MRRCWILGTGEAKNGQPAAAVFAGLNALPHEQKTPKIGWWRIAARDRQGLSIVADR